MPLRIPENDKKVCKGRNFAKDAPGNERSGKATTTEATKPIQVAAIKHRQESTISIAVTEFTLLSVFSTDNATYLLRIMPKEFCRHIIFEWICPQLVYML